MLSFPSDKAKCFAEKFCRNCNIDDSISLYLFFLLELTDLDWSKASGPDFIPVVVLKNCELELS